MTDLDLSELQQMLRMATETARIFGRADHVNAHRLIEIAERLDRLLAGVAEPQQITDGMSKFATTH